MKIFKRLAFLLLLLPFATMAQDNQRTLLNISEITVKPGHNEQFLQGVKLWKECYLKNKGTDHWNFWHRVQGKGNVYVLAGPMANWAEMDKDEPANKECRMTVENFILPHVESVEYNIASVMPDISAPANEAEKVIWVTFFKVKNSTAFNDVIQTTTAAIKTDKGKLRSTWFDMMGGGTETPDYFVSTPYADFAALDKDTDNVWKIYERVNGKKATDAVREKLRSSVDDIWSYLYTLDKDLSN